MKKESESLFMQPSETSIAMDYTGTLYMITDQESIMYFKPEVLMLDVGKS